MSTAAPEGGEDDRAHEPLGPAVLDQLVSGKSVDTIADARNFTRERVERILRTELKAISIRPARDYAKLQIRRLEAIASKLMERLDKGDVDTVDRLLKTLDRLDRYHGFSTQTACSAARRRRFWRERLYAKLAHAARRSAELNAPA